MSDLVSRFVGNLTNLLVWSVLAYMLYAVLLLPLYTYFRRNTPYAAPGAGSGGNDNDGPRPPRPWFGGFGGGPGGGGGGGSGPGNGGGGAGGSHFDDDMADTKPSAAQRERERTGTPAPANANANVTAGFRPGFWSGLAAGAGGLAAANTLRDRFADTAPPAARQRWEAPTMQQQQHQGRRAQTVQPRGFFGGGGGGAAGGADWDRGEGGSGLGAMRTSSGFGGTRNR